MIDAPDLTHETLLLADNAVHCAAIVMPMPEVLVPNFQSVRMQIARPPHFAEREELDAALAAGTREALLLFVERHPQSRYRAEAERALRSHGAAPSSR